MPTFVVIDVHEGEHGEALAHCGYFVLPDPPYNIKRVQYNDNLIHGIFTSTDMKAMEKLCSEVLRPDADGHVFCSASQWSPWYRCYQKKMNNMRIQVSQRLVPVVRGGER